MYKKLASVALATILCALATACKKDADVLAVVDEFDVFTKEIVKRIDANPTAAGVDDAQKYFDSKKADVAAKLGSLKDVRGFQIGEETKKKMMETISNDAMSIAKLKLKTIGNRDPAFNSKIDKLIQDFQSLVKNVGS